MNTPMPRLHMGCGEALRSHWLIEAAHAERKTPEASHKPARGKRKRERTRG